MLTVITVPSSSESHPNIAPGAAVPSTSVRRIGSVKLAEQLERSRHSGTGAGLMRKIRKEDDEVMYCVTFQKKDRAEILKIRLDSWSALIAWLMENPGMKELWIWREE